MKRLLLIIISDLPCDSRNSLVSK